MYTFDITIQRNPRSVIKVDSQQLYGYWEWADGSEGGSLLFDRTPTGHLDLIDFDGAYELPQKVVDALRAHGQFIVDSTFDC